jgi:hypothetical protein
MAADIFCAELIAKILPSMKRMVFSSADEWVV